ncbi:DUF742 domain-containing protein [Catellatospora tritici]|uniref:DUF742 domain-containing protein n=1 Tax=Catellatospora tritici TaxID=2851566 RepID=UPI001C2DDCD3|nr:DUF742 domain-containing protein [Catellatospora tritici]MBV1850787.1 DUF742 domain-containing protein [Catellatospora tritici]MBV1851040.1 DUF742 domain-containing protein [Catellatospora tritici]
MDDSIASAGGGWAQEDAGPTVRPYAVTSGRTRPVRGAFDLISIVMALRSPAAPDGTSPEVEQILRCCRLPVSVAELAARLDLPSGTVKVLLGDLLEQRLIATRSPAPELGTPNRPVLEAVIHGLRAL